MWRSLRNLFNWLKSAGSAVGYVSVLSSSLGPPTFAWFIAQQKTPSDFGKIRSKHKQTGALDRIFFIAANNYLQNSVQGSDTLCVFTASIRTPLFSASILYLVKTTNYNKITLHEEIYFEPFKP